MPGTIASRGGDGIITGDMLGIPTYLFRLLPGNPILLRVVALASKRHRDLFTRCIYLGLLVGLVIVAIISTGDVAGTSLDQLTVTSEAIFKRMSFLQLFLVSLLAPVFTAGAISQEKDSQTYDILLSTPLSNAQIVLGSLCSRLFFIIALLVSGIPVFAITKIFGGIAIGDIITSFTIAAATACVTGALATAIATFKVGTRRTIFSFYMICVVYLVGLFLLDQLPYFHPFLLDPATGAISSERAATSWFTGIHPFLSQATLFPGYRPPDETLLPPALRRWPLEWFFTKPSTFFPAFMTALSVLLVFPSILVLRRMAQTSSTLATSLLKKVPLPFVRAVRRPRLVWNNPVAWREARTKASVARASLLRWTFILVGLSGALVILVMYQSPAKQPASFIKAGSYNSIDNVLTILGEEQTYTIEPVTNVVLDGHPVATAALGGRYEVVTRSTKTVRGVKVLTDIQLATIPGKLSRTTARQFLLGAIIIEVAVILLIVTNAAASTVTREREDGTLDLLLSTPITSRHYIWGKLIGLVSFMLPLVAVPVISVILFIALDSIEAIFASQHGFQWLVLPEAVILMPTVLIVVVAFATIVGMRMSLSNKTTVRAVMSSLGIVIGLMAMLGWCGNTAVNSQTPYVLGTAISAMSPLGVIATLIDPFTFGGRAWDPVQNNDITEVRVTLFFFSLIAVGIYGFAVWIMYRSMIKNFDMTIRRQTR